MLSKADVLEAIAAGTVTLAFRRWRRAPPQPGATLRTPVGVLVLERVQIAREREITEADAERAGAPSRSALLASLRSEGTLYRIELRLAGEDPRLQLREQRRRGVRRRSIGNPRLWGKHGIPASEPPQSLGLPIRPGFDVPALVASHG